MKAILRSIEADPPTEAHDRHDALALAAALCRVAVAFERRRETECVCVCVCVCVRVFLCGCAPEICLSRQVWWGGWVGGGGVHVSRRMRAVGANAYGAYASPDSYSWLADASPARPVFGASRRFAYRVSRRLAFLCRVTAAFERERERQRERERVCVCPCVCVCTRNRRLLTSVGCGQ